MQKGNWRWNDAVRSSPRPSTCRSRWTSRSSRSAVRPEDHTVEGDVSSSSAHPAPLGLRRRYPSGTALVTTGGRQRPLCAPYTCEAVAHEGCQRDARREQRSDQKRRAGVPWSCEEPADKRQRADRHRGCLPSRPSCGHEPSRAEQSERALTDRYCPFVTMLDGEPKACRSEERVEQTGRSKEYPCLAGHQSNLVG